MEDGIKDMFVSGRTLHLVRGSDVWSVTAIAGKEPNEWPMTHFANMGASEDFFVMFSAELPELLGGAQIYGEEREAAKAAITTILTDGLMPAFDKLQEIRVAINKPMPELNRQQLYEDFAGKLWFAYKELFQKAVKCLGFDIGFLFTNGKDFENGLGKFVTRDPALILDVSDLFRRQRINWQQGLHSFRNKFVDHRSKDREEFTAYYEPHTAERLFDHAWRTMAELLPCLIEARFSPTVSIIRVPAEEYNSQNPRQWRLVFCTPVDRGRFARRESSEPPCDPACYP